MRTCSAIGLILLFSSLVQGGDPPEPTPLHFNVSGEKREAIVSMPDTPRNKPAPVVFVFHGHGSTMEAFARRWNVHEYWPEAIGVYMQGLPTASRVDPKGKKAGWQSVPHTENDRDVKFVDAVLKTLHERRTIDDDRIYAAGLSNGGGFSYVLWMTRPDIFASFAPCAAVLHHDDNSTLQPRPVFHIAGENDETAPFKLQQESMAAVRKANHCKNEPVDWEPGCKLYRPKSNTGADFVSLIHPGGHGAPPHTFETIIKFFKEHPRQHAKSAIE